MPPRKHPPEGIEAGPFVPSEVQVDRLRNLSDMQRRCVELVSLGPSKVIAQRLGISHNTVDDYLKEACRRLGVRSRFQAAATLAAALAKADGQLAPTTPLPQAWGSQAQPIAPVDEADSMPLSDRQIDAERERGLVRDAGQFGPGPVAPTFTVQPRVRESGRDRAPLAHTLQRVLAYALVLAILAAAAVSIGTGFNQIAYYIETNVRHH